MVLREMFFGSWECTGYAAEVVNGIDRTSKIANGRAKKV
jgi:hypothetical protein